LSKLFEQEYKDISLHKTYELSKGLKSIREKEIYSTLNENINEKNKDPLYLDEKKIYFQKTHFKKNMKIRKEMMK
jgi:hypothetical protein